MCIRYFIPDGELSHQRVGGEWCPHQDPGLERRTAPPLVQAEVMAPFWVGEGEQSGYSGVWDVRPWGWVGV